MACSVNLQKDKLPKIINKVEYFLFRAMEKEQLDFAEVATNKSNNRDVISNDDVKAFIEASKNGQPKEFKGNDPYLDPVTGAYIPTPETARWVLAEDGFYNLVDGDNILTKGVDLKSGNQVSNVVRLLNTVKNTMIPEAVNKYTATAKAYENRSKTDKALPTDLKNAELYQSFATNLQSLIPMWNQVVANFSKYSTQFSFKTKFTLDEDGLVNLDDVADDDDKMLKKMVFDQPSNEINPVDDIDKSIELYLRSLQEAPNQYDEFGPGLSVNYSTLVRGLLADLQNTTSMDEIISILNKKAEQTPVYKDIIKKLTLPDKETTKDLDTYIKFRNSFTKTFIPLMLVSLESDNTVKVIEAATGKKGTFERVIGSNFSLKGMPFIMNATNGEVVNIGHRNEDDEWVLDHTDLPKLEKLNIYNAKDKDDTGSIDRRIEFLKAIGFELTPSTEKQLRNNQSIVGGGRYNAVNAMFEHLKYRLEQGDVIKNVINSLKKDYVVDGDIKSKGQDSFITDIVNAELKNNRDYNVDYSMVNASGDRQYSIQLHNNFTILNKFYSDVEIYPNLDSIRQEPSMFWLDPEKNPAIKNDPILNSLFYFKPGEDNYGDRKYVIKIVKKENNKFIITYEFTNDKNKQGALPVQITFNNTGGVNTRFDNERSKGSSSTSLNEIDKLLQDIYSFYSKKYSYNSVLRLGDKSTDLGMSVNYYAHPITGKPVVTEKNTLSSNPLGGVDNYATVFKSDVFLQYVINGIQDVMNMKRAAQENDFLSKYKVSAKNILNSWSYFDKILSSETKDKLKTIDSAADVKELIAKDIITYFEGENGVVKDFLNRFKDARKINTIWNNTSISFDSAVRYYLANSFITDMSQMRLFFGDPIFFKDFHKRASKDSATGIFTFIDDELIKRFNDRSNPNGYGATMNLSARRLAERVYQQKLAELESKNLKESQKKAFRDKYKTERDQAIARQDISKSFKSATLQDIDFNSLQSEKIIENVDNLIKAGHLSEKMKTLYEQSLKRVIQDGYKKGNEADGQGKCTFDFYKLMSILTGQWSDDQERVYKKIVDYAHFSELAENEKDSEKRLEYIKQRDAVGYNPSEEVYFPPKKFQYSGTENNEYGMYVPIFDKFSLQPLIPTNIKRTADEHLAKRMEYNGIGYIKFESGTKTEVVKDKDSYYSEYDKNNPSERSILPFSPEQKFKSEQELFFNNFKEQLTIDASIHDHAVFGSQIRKLILMNLDKEQFKQHYNNYNKFIAHLTELEKTSLYNEMGINRVDGRLHISDINKLVDYFFKEIDKKNQDSNVRKALKYDEQTKKFEIPLDGSVQAQILEGIVISAINNRAVRYKTNGSMLTQVAITGSEQTNKFDKASSDKAYKTFGNKELNYYSVDKDSTGKYIVKPMEVKIALTGQWLNLLNLSHYDGYKINSIGRLNDCLKNERWFEVNKRSLELVAYRIPTQGRNFMDVMRVKEFIPASFGDAIIMPSECVIKSGSDFDIDKMFVFYPNLNQNGEAPNNSYTDNQLKDPNNYKALKANIQNKLYNTMSDIILDPANYLELVTPSDNFHIMPIIDDIYKLLGKPVNNEGKHIKSDFVNTDIVNRNINIDKFISLLKGKSDLGIAAIANTFNVLFQHGKATGNTKFFTSNNIISFFNIKDSLEKEELIIKNIDYSSPYDEEGVLKSEFFSEFINAFVDAAKDDYVFAVNVVTELSPIMFYMKYAGMSSKKILGFVNQPAIRQYIKTLSTYQNKFVKGEQAFDDGVKTIVLRDTLTKLGYEFSQSDIDPETGFNKYGTRNGIQEYLFASNKPININELISYFNNDDKLFSQIKDQNININSLTDDEKKRQIAFLLELQNLRLQSNSISEAQKVLKFDTSPFKNTFDIYQREQMYNDMMSGNNVLSPESISNIYHDSTISPLNVSKDIKALLSSLFPIRNNDELNNFLLNKAIAYKNEMSKNGGTFVTNDDIMKISRVAKNDMMNYILQNLISKSEKGVAYFKERYNTDKSFNEYLLELAQTDKLKNNWLAIKESPSYKSMAAQFPILKNIIIERGVNNGRIVNFRILENSSNPVEKEQTIQQFEDLTNSSNEQLSSFFKDLSLYSIFQSGMNTSDISFMSVVPTNIVSRLYGSAVEEYNKLPSERKTAMLSTFYKMFTRNNPELFSRKSTDTLTKEVSKRGKWYSEQVPFNEVSKIQVLQPIKETTKEKINNQEKIEAPVKVEESSIEEKISKWFEKNKGEESIKNIPLQVIVESYNQERIGNQTIEEYLIDKFGCQ